ncbi:prepilin peptidase [Phyllobacterium myrsinacearum]|uniref:Leader peptidase (Prepilin peptidase)/N-methyltransferase n=1 Tax=Phyllobacterium myrsinacearum TaxID=28101 RepID=A0A839EPM8_9HYPH|nr:A24 family peptidase [Phyllobacterium myrsinacearum]MBA8882031.1 leader peptidase (prepilin peptidase)/N-methyltransferase [Phyllobacterium myrsinacearum]
MGDPAVFAILIIIVAAICYFDFRFFVVPDWLNLLLFGTGIMMKGLAGWHDAVMALLVATGVSLMLFLVREVHRRYTGRIGLGLGDVKLAGASSVWFSPWNFPLYLFFASLTALIYYALRYGISGRESRTLRIPFGPFLGLALLATWGAEHIGYFKFAPQ